MICGNRGFESLSIEHGRLSAKTVLWFFYETSMELIHIPVFTIISLSDALEYYSAVVKSAGELLDNPVLFR